MSDYLGLNVESDPDVLMDQALGTLALNIPGFIAREAHLEVWVLETVARMIAETRYMFSKVPDGIFRYFGESLVNVPQIEGSRATALTDWVMIDDAGYTVFEGAQVAYRIAGDKLSVFTVQTGFTVEPGQTTASNVVVSAPEIGEAYNNLGPSGLELVDSLAFVSSVTASGSTSGGVDRETDAAYLSRLRNEMSLLAPRFVLASDAAVLAQRIGGVSRALGIDNYDPITNTFNNEKTITVAVVGSDGLPLSNGVKEEVRASLESLREINFIINVIDPNYTEIDVNFVVVVYDGYDTTTVDNAATAAVENYLSPSNWAGGDSLPAKWRTSENVVRYLEVAEVLNRVDGVNYVQTLTINGASSDALLNGVAPLPSVGVVSGSAVND